MPAPERHVADATGKDTNCLRVAADRGFVSGRFDWLSAARWRIARRLRVEFDLGEWRHHPRSRCGSPRVRMHS